MKRLKFKKIHYFALIGLGICPLFTYAGKSDCEEASNPEKKRKIQDWELKDEGNQITVTNPNGEKLSYQYQLFTDRFLSKEKLFIKDSIGEWACIILKYKPNLRSEEPLLEYVWFNPSEGIYNVIYDKPEVERNRFSFVPIRGNANCLWTFNDNQGGIHFLSDVEGRELEDAEGNKFSIRKATNADQVIYSLHVMGKDHFNCINISEYLKQDYNVEVESIGTYARLLNKKTGLALLIEVTDKETEEKAWFGIDVTNIINKKQEFPFWRADLYSHSAPIINDKNRHKWKEIRQEMINVKKDPIISSDGNHFCYPPVTNSEGDHFYYRSAQRKLKEDISNEYISSLHVVDKEGIDSNINLTYWSSFEFDSKTYHPIKKLTLKGNGQYIWFSYGGEDADFIKIKDIKKQNYKPFYSPIQGVSFEYDNLRYYVDFISFNIDRCILNQDENHVKDLFSKYINELSFFLHQLSSGDYHFNYISHDPISTFKDIRRNIPANRDQIIKVQKGNRIENVCSYKPVLDSKSISDIKNACFNSNFLLTENFNHNSQEATKIIFNREAEMFLAYFIHKDAMSISEEELNLLKRIYIPKLIEEFCRYRIAAYKNISAQDEAKMVEHELNNNQNLNYQSPISFYTYLNSINHLLASSEIYTEEFQKVLNHRNWSPFSNREEGIKAFEILNRLMDQYGFYIDLEKKEFWIEQKDDN